MYIIEKATGKKYPVTIEQAGKADYKRLSKEKYVFNWKKEKKHNVFKLRRTANEDILGALSLQGHEKEKRVEIRLLSVAEDSMGKNKKYERIAGTLIAYACREAVKLYGTDATVSFIPVDGLKKYYINKYNMADSGGQISLQGLPLLKIINQYVQ
ncbi:MAG: N-acetyltransferase [Bacteroidia bacterium]